MMDSRLLHYRCIDTFRKKFYKDLLTKEHMQFAQIQIQKLRFPDGQLEEEANFWGYLFVKNGAKYLISSTGDSGEEIKVADMLPIMPMDIEKVANTKGEVFFLVRRPVSVRFKEEQKHTPKKFIDSLSGLSHTMDVHKKLSWMLALSQLWDRSNYRIATPAGFGKDSVIDICNSLFGDCGTIESPTIAKLEDRASVLKWLVVNEVVDLGKTEWDVIQQFLLAVGGHKNEITKHSRAFQNVKEVIDICNFSMSLFYNDITHYPNAQKKYFDMTTKSAVLDRFPAFRFYGKFTEDFNSIGGLDIDSFVENNMDTYKDLLYSFHYYKKNHIKHLHKYDRSKLMKMSSNRDSTNINKLLNIVDLYSDTQEEFNMWVDTINLSLEDYYCMVHTYIHSVRSFCKKHRLILKDVYPDDSKIELEAVAHYCYQEGRKDDVWVEDKHEQIYKFIITLDLNNSTYLDVVSKLRSFGLKKEDGKKSFSDNKTIWDVAKVKKVEEDIL